MTMMSEENLLMRSAVPSRMTSISGAWIIRRNILRRQRNVTVLMAEVSAIDTAKRKLNCVDASTFDFDYLLVAKPLSDTPRYVFKFKDASVLHVVKVQEMAFRHGQ